MYVSNLRVVIYAILQFIYMSYAAQTFAYGNLYKCIEEIKIEILKKWYNSPTGEIKYSISTSPLAVLVK